MNTIKALLKPDTNTIKDACCLSLTQIPSKRCLNTMNTIKALLDTNTIKDACCLSLTQIPSKRCLNTMNTIKALLKADTNTIKDACCLSLTQIPSKKAQSAGLRDLLQVLVPILWSNNCLVCSCPVAWRETFCLRVQRWLWFLQQRGYIRGNWEPCVLGWWAPFAWASQQQNCTHTHYTTHTHTHTTLHTHYTTQGWWV